MIEGITLQDQQLAIRHMTTHPMGTVLYLQCHQGEVELQQIRSGCTYQRKVIVASFKGSNNVTGYSVIWVEFTPWGRVTFLLCEQRLPPMLLAPYLQPNIAVLKFHLFYNDLTWSVIHVHVCVLYFLFDDFRFMHLKLFS